MGFRFATIVTLLAVLHVVALVVTTVPVSSGAATSMLVLNGLMVAVMTVSLLMWMLPYEHLRRSAASMRKPAVVAGWIGLSGVVGGTTVSCAAFLSAHAFVPPGFTFRGLDPRAWGPGVPDAEAIATWWAVGEFVAIAGGLTLADLLAYWFRPRPFAIPRFESHESF